MCNTTDAAQAVDAEVIAMRTRMMLRLKMLLLLIRLLISSRKLRVISPPIWLKEMSTTMLSTRHFSSFTCGQNKDTKLTARQACHEAAALLLLLLLAGRLTRKNRHNT
jgi:hypothetical protein